MCVPITALTLPSKYQPKLNFSAVASAWKSTKWINSFDSFNTSSIASYGFDGFKSLINTLPKILVTLIQWKKVIIESKDWKMIRDYIVLLEGQLHRVTGQTFSSIEEEMLKIFGEEKVKLYYGKENKKNESRI